MLVLFVENFQHVQFISITRDPKLWKKYQKVSKLYSSLYFSIIKITHKINFQRYTILRKKRKGKN